LYDTSVSKNSWGYVQQQDYKTAESIVGDLVEELAARPRVGLVGCRQLDATGAVYPTIRRFPTAVRLFFEAVGSERFPFRASWLGEREHDRRLMIIQLIRRLEHRNGILRTQHHHQSIVYFGM